MKRKVLSITGSRSDYAAMTPVFRALSRQPQFVFHLLVTTMHVAPAYRSNLNQILSDNFGALHVIKSHKKKGEYLQSTKLLGTLIERIAELIRRQKPDLILLQGDRGEMLAAAIASIYANIPIVHMSGGDFSGSIDDSIRNSITKLAHIHLTTCRQSTEHLESMGEEKRRIFQVGEPILDALRTIEFIPKNILSKKYNLDSDKPLILGIQHPVVTEAEEARGQILITIRALEKLPYHVIFFYPNTDIGAASIRATLETKKQNKLFSIIPTLPLREYLSLMRIASVIVGNSSSGIIEAPSFKLPTVNIGTRQHDRVRASNVIDVGYNKQEINQAIKYALNNKTFRSKLNTNNPYGDGHAVEKTINILLGLKLGTSLLTKWIHTNESFTTHS